MTVQWGPIPPSQFTSGHPDFLGIGAVGGSLDESLQPLLVIEHQQSRHKKAIQPSMQVGGKIWLLRPYSQGVQVLSDHSHESPRTCMYCRIEQCLVTEM